MVRMPFREKVDPKFHAPTAEELTVAWQRKFAGHPAEEKAFIDACASPPGTLTTHVQFVRRFKAAVRASWQVARNEDRVPSVRPSSIWNFVADVTVDIPLNKRAGFSVKELRLLREDMRDIQFTTITPKADPPPSKPPPTRKTNRFASY